MLLVLVARCFFFRGVVNIAIFKVFRAYLFVSRSNFGKLIALFEI